MSDIEVRGPITGRREEVVTGEALAFVAGLERRFRARRRELLERRRERQRRIDAGELPDFRADTSAVRSGDWKVAPAPPDLSDRRVEITGPTDRKMVINALNSGASVFMADFEDANCPTWANMVDGQVNLMDAVRGAITLEEGDKRYELAADLATLVVRPRGWHLDEPRVVVDGAPMSGSLFDFGLYVFHNAAAALERGSGPYFYLPKLEAREEARLWNDVFVASQQELGLPIGTIRATVLIEHILAAFEMEEILYELREHSAGLNAGRWDYIFSVIKEMGRRPEAVLPDRAQVTMTVPFMRAYTELLVRTCHRRGAHAIGGMAAFIPSRRDPQVNERAIAAVRADKEREAGDGCDGTWVAHPDLVPVAREVFDAKLGERPNQLERQREDVDVTAADLLDIRVPDGAVSEAGLRNNVSVGLIYLESWLRGQGAVAIYNLMEDAATAEISRSQVWQWLFHGSELDTGERVTGDLVDRIIDEELDKVRDLVGADAFDSGRFGDARQVFREVATGEDLPEFLTIPASARLPGDG